MACNHLNQLYKLCNDMGVRLSSTDLIHIVCKQCQKSEVCPSVMYEQFDTDADGSESGTEPMAKGEEPQRKDEG